MITRSTFKKSDKVKFKVIKPLMRLDKIVTYELKDGGDDDGGGGHDDDGGSGIQST